MPEGDPEFPDDGLPNDEEDCKPTDLLLLILIGNCFCPPACTGRCAGEQSSHPPHHPRVRLGGSAHSDSNLIVRVRLSFQASLSQLYRAIFINPRGQGLGLGSRVFDRNLASENIAFV